jgi:hypothetical protein
MAYEGRKVDLCAQIYCAVSTFFLTASCWWQAAAMVRKAEARIPRNKMRPRSLELGIFGQALLCLVVLLAAAMLPWREEALAMKDPGASFNKALFGRRASEANQGGDSSSKRHGGDTRKEQAEICSRISHCYGVVMLQNQGEHSRWPKDWPPTLKIIWWSRSKLALMAMASSTSKRRPLLKLLAAPHFLPVTSGFVPVSGEEGCRWSFSYSGECKGPDCLILFSFRVLHVKHRDWTVIFFSFQVPDVTCTSTADN